ncbi:DUF732 domain-containing protein [Streptomyces lavendulocolor]|uniref:DUF732 domain-containing protein n=1 Tax=Streptomyces lavendulocolor TaxID=67316 RepID=UPI003C2EA8E8
MRTHLIAGAVLAALALTACEAADEPEAKPKASPPATAAASSAPADTGIPPEPTGPDRQKYLQALTAIDPALVTDEDKAIDAGRNQCSALHGGAARPDWLAAQRFGNDARPVTEATGKRINAALRGTLCP